MAERIGVCAKCGSKFKIPPTFKGSTAKCKKCGGQVDIVSAPAAGSSPPPSAPKELKPAGAKPAAKPASPGKAVKKAAPAPAAKGPGEAAAPKPQAAAKAPRSMSASERARGGKSGGRATRERTARKKSPPWLWIGIGGAVVIVVVIVFLLLPSGDEEIAAETSAATAMEETAVDTAAMEAEELPLGKAGETAEVEPAPEPEEPPPAPKPETVELQPVIEFELLPPIIGCSQERFEELTDSFMNGMIKAELPLFQRKRLKETFEKAMTEGFEVVPVILNGFNGLDLRTADGVVKAFNVADFWNKFTGSGFTDVPVRGDTSDSAMKENLSWNYKAIMSLVRLWSAKVDDEEKQQEFFSKIQEARDLEAERQQDEARGK